MLAWVLPMSPVVLVHSQPNPLVSERLRVRPSVPPDARRETMTRIKPYPLCPASRTSPRESATGSDSSFLTAKNSECSEALRSPR